MRRKLLSPTVRAVAGALATSVAVQGLLFITGILAARLLGPADRGYLALIWTVSLTVSQVGTLGLPLAVTLELSSGRTTIPALLHGIGRRVGLLIVVVTAIQAAAVVVLLDVSSVPAAPAWVSVAVVPLILVLTFALAAIQGVQRFGAMNLARITPLIVYAIGLPVLAIIGDVSLMSVVAVWSSGYVVAAVVSVWACRPRPDDPRPDESEQSDPDLRSMLRFGLRGFLGWASPTETLRVDQLVVGLVLPARTLGIYVAALAFTNLPRFVAMGIGLVAYPAVANARGDARRRAMIVYTALGAGISVAACGVIAALAGPLVRLAFGDEFASASGPLRVLLVATALLCVRRIVSDVLRGAGQEQRGSQAEALSWIVLIPGLILLADPYGLDGVAWTLVGTYALSLAAIVVLSRREGFDDSGPVDDAAPADAAAETTRVIPGGSPPPSG